MLLIFTADLVYVFKMAMEDHCDSDTPILSKAAKIIPQDVLSMEKSELCGTFESKCQDNSIPRSLQSLVGIMLGDPRVETQSAMYLKPRLR